MSWKCPEAAHNLPLPPAPVRKEAPIVDFLKEVLPLSSVQPAIASKPPCSSPVAVSAEAGQVAFSTPERLQLGNSDGLS